MVPLDGDENIGEAVPGFFREGQLSRLEECKQGFKGRRELDINLQTRLSSP